MDIDFDAAARRFAKDSGKRQQAADERRAKLAADRERSRAQRAATWGRLALWYTRVEFGLKNASKSTSVRTASLALGLQRTSASR